MHRKEKIFFAAVGILASLLVLYLYIHIRFFQSEENTTQYNEDSQQTGALVDAGMSQSVYQEAVTPLLQTLAQSTDPEVELANVTNLLKPMTVSAEVASDHLTLFLALDSWRRYPDNDEQLAIVRTKLEEFSAGQPWSAEMIELILSKIPNAT